MGQKVHPIGFRSETRLKNPGYASNTWINNQSRDFIK